jgi:putative ABC transport system permease protein
MIFDRDKWQEIFGTMRKHKLRTGLTALGVFWGIFMLIFLLGMGKGLENGVYQDFGKKTKNLMYVWTTPTSKPYEGFQPGRRPQLKMEDIQALRDQLPGLEYIAPRHSENAPVYRKDQGQNWEIRGELPDMIEIEALKLFQGRYINKKDLDEARKVCVIGERIREVLFKDDPCIGEYIRIDGSEYKVVGVFGPIDLKPWTESDMESVVIPLSTMNQAFGTSDRIDYFACSAYSHISMGTLEPKVRSILKKRHHVAPDDPRGIGGFNLEEEFSKVTNLFTGINAFLWFVGIGTLLAGIVGVSNLMMIIVKERTKEIGIRKALGATPGSIINLILTESVFITSVSGYLGLFIGTLLIWGINSIMAANNLESQFFYNPEVNLTVGISAITLLIIAGAIAGFIPAIKAARIHPVDALRDE